MPVAPASGLNGRLETLLRIGERYFQSGSYTEAIKMFSKVYNSN